MPGGRCDPAQAHRAEIHPTKSIAGTSATVRRLLT
jgi:hypothetical protein